MGIDLHVTATRKIKYEDPKTKQWLDDIQTYELHTSDFNSEGNIKVVDSNTPFKTYCVLARAYWGSRDAEEIIGRLSDQIEEAENKGYTVEWEAW
jgi:hypothetical protein